MNAQTIIKPKLNRLSSNAWIIILVSSLMMGFAIYAVFNWFEIVEEEMLVGAKGEALTNPYFGFQQFLTASGATLTLANKSRELELGLAKDATPPQVLMLGDRRLTEMTPARVKKVNDWVRAGGHLVVEAEQPMLEDPLLAQFAIERKALVWRDGKYIEVPRKQDEKNAEEDDGADTDAQKSAEQKQPTDTEVTPQDTPKYAPKQPNRTRRELDRYMPSKHLSSKVTLADGTPFTAKFEPYQNVLKLPLLTTVAIDNRHLVSDRDGGRIVEFSDGLGRVTVISNFDFLTYKNLSIDDHAELIWHLVSNANSIKPRIIVALNRQSDGFWKWMTVHAWMVAISSLTLLLFWSWRVIPRMGPMALPEATSRRSLLEHMVAAGAFLAKQKQWQALVSPVRSRFIHHYKHRHPRTMNMHDAAFVQYVSRHLQIDENQLARLLFVPVASRQEAMMVLRQLIPLFSIVS
jgi:uncharacterized membrane protein